MNQPSLKPTTKVSAGAIGGAITVLLVSTLASFDIHLPSDVSAALVVIVSFVVSYFVKEKSQL